MDVLFNQQNLRTVGEHQGDGGMLEMLEALMGKPNLDLSGRRSSRASHLCRKVAFDREVRRIIKITDLHKTRKTLPYLLNLRDWFRS